MPHGAIPGNSERCAECVALLLGRGGGAGQAGGGRAGLIGWRRGQPGRVRGAVHRGAAAGTTIKHLPGTARFDEHRQSRSDKLTSQSENLLQAAATGEALLDAELGPLAARDPGRFSRLNARMQARAPPGALPCAATEIVCSVGEW